MRDAFIQELVDLAQSHDNIALMVGDLGYNVIEPFADSFPDRFVNAGIAEQNMAGMAAGMASEGYHVFTYSIANFPTFRCAEQIRNDIDYHNLPVTTVAVGGGLTYGSLGYSHHGVQDYALMRTMPNMMIASPGDPQEVRACLRYLVANPQPSYLRIGKPGTSSFHTHVPNVSPGAWLRVRTGADEDNIAHLATGGALTVAMTQVPAGHIYSMPLWGMSSKAAQSDQLDKYGEVHTYEDHLIDGGFGSWLMEANSMLPQLPRNVTPHALDPRVCGVVAGYDTLLRYGGLMD
jgi:transketolase